MGEQFKLPSEQLFQLVDDARERTLELVADLADEQLIVPKMEIVNPFRWELGHVAFFYDVFLLRILGSDKFLLEGAEHLEETLAYMRQVFEQVVDRLGSHAPNPQETYLYLLSVLHEDMHGEAFTYMRQTLEHPEPLLSIAQTRSALAEIRGGPLPGDVEIPGRLFSLALRGICRLCGIMRNGPIPRKCLLSK